MTATVGPLASATGRASAEPAATEPAETGELAISPHFARRECVEAIVTETQALLAEEKSRVMYRLVKDSVSLAHVTVLFMLRYHGAVPMSRLAERLEVSFPNASGLIDRMVERGLVERHHIAGDRRVVIVAPTARGLAITDEIDGLRSGLLAEVFDALEDRELGRLLAAIRRIRARSPAPPLDPRCPADLMTQTATKKEEVALDE